jgi:hypothetical protein
MVRRIASGLSLIALLYAANASAEDDEGPHPAQVTLHADESVQMRVIGRNPMKPLALCNGVCQLWALPGRYTVYTQDNTTGARRELNLRVNGFAEYHLIQGNDTVHDLGVGLDSRGIARCDEHGAHARALCGRDPE